jgi:hypothetical protein
MIGILEQVLCRRYGDPSVDCYGDALLYRWAFLEERLHSVLYKFSASTPESSVLATPLQEVYGDFLGGSLLGGSLKVAMWGGPDVFGLYRLDELQARPVVRRASHYESSLCFFMDAANVWYYAVKNEHLYVLDTDTDEIDCLGATGTALHGLLTEWEQAEANWPSP